MTLKKTPLNQIHKSYGGRMVDYAGWEMPVQYEGALREHLAVREAVGVFDVSHMGELEVTGPDALRLVQSATSNDVAKLSDGQAQYSALLYPEGTFVDDVVVYRLSGRHFLICVNAANREKDFAWLSGMAEGEVQVEDRSDQYVQLAVQGPRAAEVLQELTDVDLASIAVYWFKRGVVAGAEAIVSRTGYTGEDGFEIYFPPRDAETVWEALFRAGAGAGIRPAGLAARNTLRLEMKYALYGNDINEKTTPLEAGLGWIVKLSKDAFVGREALLKQKADGVSRRLVGFEMVDKGIARDHYPVVVDGQPVGEVTSGSFAPSIDKAVGLTYLPTESAQVGQIIEVEIRGKRARAEVVKTPFYRKP